MFSIRENNPILNLKKKKSRVEIDVRFGFNTKFLGTWGLSAWCYGPAGSNWLSLLFFEMSKLCMISMWENFHICAWIVKNVYDFHVGNYHILIAYPFQTLGFQTLHGTTCPSSPQCPIAATQPCLRVFLPISQIQTQNLNE